MCVVRWCIDRGQLAVGGILGLGGRAGGNGGWGVQSSNCEGLSKGRVFAFSLFGIGKTLDEVFLWVYLRSRVVILIGLLTQLVL